MSKSILTSESYTDCTTCKAAISVLLCCVFH